MEEILGASAKGTVTSLSSLFPVEDAQKAANRVLYTLAEKQKEVDRVRGFISDNSNLINLVQKLPEDLHHDIMVPFGKAAFFPGRLVHTNEFMVLLGEGYYAERTSKQTIDILKRRGKALESQVDSLKAMIGDFKAKASFFDSTASEVADGLVEITEEYVEESLESGPVKQDTLSLSPAKNAKEDEEYACLMSRLDELEEEELAAGSDYADDEDLGDHENDEDEQTKPIFDRFSDQKLLEDVQTKPLFDGFSDQKLEDNCSYLEEDENIGGEEVMYRRGSTSQSKVRFLQDNASNRRSSVENVSKSTSDKKAEMFHKKVEESVQAVVPSTNEMSQRSSKSEIDSQKAFLGSIVERTYINPKNAEGLPSTSSQSSVSLPSKPVSRFKLHRI